ncbi:uncharacterized protein LOC144548422 [Carex rostrata]
MAICRSRRRGGGRPLLPSTISFLPPNYLSLSSSFWFLKVWFSLGACFGLVALLIVSIMLIWNSWGAVSFKGGAFLLDNFFSPGQSISFLDFVLLLGRHKLAFWYILTAMVNFPFCLLSLYQNP